MTSGAWNYLMPFEGAVTGIAPSWLIDVPARPRRTRRFLTESREKVQAHGVDRLMPLKKRGGNLSRRPPEGVDGVSLPKGAQCPSNAGW